LHSGQQQTPNAQRPTLNIQRRIFDHHIKGIASESECAGFMRFAIPSSFDIRASSFVLFVFNPALSHAPAPFGFKSRGSETECVGFMKFVIPSSFDIRASSFVLFVFNPALSPVPAPFGFKKRN